MSSKSLLDIFSFLITLTLSYGFEDDLCADNSQMNIFNFVFVVELQNRQSAAYVTLSEIQ